MIVPRGKPRKPAVSKLPDSNGSTRARLLQDLRSSTRCVEIRVRTPIGKANLVRAPCPRRDRSQRLDVGPDELKG